MGTSVRAELSRRFRALLSGAQSGVPEWTPLVAAGEDLGLYAPNDAPWIVHADLATMIGGIRALLMQAMHPGSLAGVAQHSRYEQDVLGRLSGTIRWLTITTFGSLEAIENEAARVRGMHSRVRGSFTENSGTERKYQASDPDLLLWVHLAFTDSFLTAHQIYGEKDIPGGADAYVNLWAKSVAPIGLAEAPLNLIQLQQKIAEFAPTLRVDEKTNRIVGFLKSAPLPFAAKPAYWWLFLAAVDTLPNSYRKQLGLRTLPSWMIRPATKLLLRVMRFIVGSESPIESAALSRRNRLTQQI